MKTLQAKKAVTLLNNLIAHTATKGLDTDSAVNDLKALRPFTITEEIPLLAKATRLAYEHLDEYGTFAIPIPEEEALEGEETIAIEGDAKESFYYFLCLIRDVDRTANEEELRVYVKALNEY